MNAVLEHDTFRASVRDWLNANFPTSLRGRSYAAMVDQEPSLQADLETWRSRLAGQGWGAPTWPAEYGGAGLSHPDAKIIQEELEAAGAFNPIPSLAGMGVTMVGPTMLEYGTDDQKLRHLPPIARGETAWCQGYSEPGAGSDLASMQTKAEDKGDYYLVNGSKIWTSGADYADWIFCLVRTDKQAPKHEGISFLLFSMDSPGVTTLPIVLLNGQSPFCQTFFDNVQVPKSQLVHKVNQGWSVAKRLLQH